MRLRKQVFISYIDQALVSVTNLGIGLFFVHFASKTEYALYSIAFGATALFVSLGNGFILSPMIVTAMGLEGRDRKVRCEAFLFIEVTVLIPSLLVLTSVFAIFIAKVANNVDLAIFILSAVFAGAAAMIQEYFRRHAFMNDKAINALTVDLVFSGCVGILLAVFRSTYEDNEMHLWGIIAYGLAAFVAGWVGLLSARFREPLRWDSFREAALASWVNGPWAAGGGLITWIQGQSYAYVLAMLGASESLAEANAIRLFLSPVTLLNTSIMNVIMPRLASMKAEGKLREMLRGARVVMWFMLGVLVTYSALVFLLQDELITVLLTAEYSNSSEYLLAWAGLLFVQAIRTNSSIILQVLRCFRYLAKANLLGALVVLITTYGFVRYYGAVGSIGAMIAGEFTLALLLHLNLRNQKTIGTL